MYVTEWVPVRKGDRRSRGSTRREIEAGVAALRPCEAPGARSRETRAKREHERAAAAEGVRPDHAAGPSTTRRARWRRPTRPRRAATAQIAHGRGPAGEVVDRARRSTASSRCRGVNVGDRVENMGGNGADVPDRRQPRARPDGDRCPSRPAVGAEGGPADRRSRPTRCRAGRSRAR
ncbi:MAG: hypothetical protein MZV63_18070 [Marinilabiliales bacterium]|nr:hypothetical protein [Marinilabiliales bacterium]